MHLQQEIITLLSDILLVNTEQWHADTEIIGAIPEFDSMAIVTFLTKIEENYGVEIEDDELSAEDFETLGSLTTFVKAKIL